MTHNYICVDYLQFQTILLTKNEKVFVNSALEADNLAGRILQKLINLYCIRNIYLILVFN